MDNDEIQFGFIPGYNICTNITMFILRQLREKYLVKKKNLYTAIVDLEKLLIERLEMSHDGLSGN